MIHGADQIAAITGLPEEKVEGIVARLIEAGMLLVEGQGSPSVLPSLPPGGRSSAPPGFTDDDVLVPSAASIPAFDVRIRWLITSRA